MTFNRIVYCIDTSLVWVYQNPSLERRYICEIHDLHNLSCSLLLVNQHPNDHQPWKNMFSSTYANFTTQCRSQNRADTLHITHSTFTYSEAKDEAFLLYY